MNTLATDRPAVTALAASVRFDKEMMHYFLDNMADLEVCTISQQDTEQALSLTETKYKTWEWNFAYGPEYTFRNAFRLDENLHTCSIIVNNGIVKECIIKGSDKLMRVSEMLPGCRHMVPDFLNVFERENIDIAREEIFNFF